MKKSPPPSRQKRPAATLDLKAKELKPGTPSKETPKAETSAKETGPKDPTGKSTSGTTASAGTAPKKAATKTPARKSSAQTRTKSASTKSTASKSPTSSPGREQTTKSQTTSDKIETSLPSSGDTGGSSSGGFFSHLLASIIGAVLGIFGLSFASNQNLMPAGFELSGGPTLIKQIEGLQSKVGLIEKQTASNDANSLGGRLAQLASRVENAEAGLGAGHKENLGLAEKVTRLENTLAGLEEAAKTGTGGELAGLTAVTKELKQSSKQTANLKTEFIKLREEQSGFREDLANVRSAQADFRTSTAKLSDELAKLQNSAAKIKADASRPPDISAQINPVMTELSALQTKIEGLLGREAGSKAEGRNIALALSLGELKRAVSQGTPYKAELDRVIPHAPAGLDLSSLISNADKGLATSKVLRAGFASASHKTLAAENTAASGSFVDQIMANAKSMVQVRPTGLVEGETTGAILSRMEFKLDRNNLEGALKESSALQGTAKDVMRPWLEKAQSRHLGDKVLRALEDKIRNALAGGGTQ